MYSDEKLDTIFKTTIYGINIHMYIYTYFNKRHIDTLYIYDKSLPFLTARFPSEHLQWKQKWTWLYIAF